IVIQHVREDPLVAAIIDGGKNAEGTIIQFIGGHIPRKIRQRPVQEVGVHARLRLLSPRPRPVLDRGTRDTDAMVAPEVPTRGPVGQAVFDHQPDCQIHHAVGVLSAGWCQIREVRVKVLATLRPGVLRIGDHEIPRTPQVEMPQVVQCPLGLLVAIGLVPTTRTRLPEVVATVGDDLGLGQVGGCGDPRAWVGSILTWTEHRVALLAQRFGPELYDKRRLGATRCTRYSIKIFRITEEVYNTLQMGASDIPYKTYLELSFEK